jgi:uncharacterized integral membrane protein
MMLLKSLIFVVLLVVLVFVGLKNNTPVELHLFQWSLVDVPLYLALFGAALFGLLIGLIFAGVREVQWRVALSRQRRDSADAERELRDLRVAPLERGNDEDLPG